MKKGKLLLASVLVVTAFTFASCGNCCKSKEETKSECKHEHDKDHKCDSAKMDSCKHAQKDTTNCEQKHDKE